MDKKEELYEIFSSVDKRNEAENLIKNRMNELKDINFINELFPYELVIVNDAINHALRHDYKIRRENLINVNDDYDIPYRLNVFKKVLLKNEVDYHVVWSRIKKAKNYKELPLEELGDLVEKARKALDRKYLPHYDPDNFNDIFYRLDYFKKVINKERLYNNKINFSKDHLSKLEKFLEKEYNPDIEEKEYMVKELCPYKFDKVKKALLKIYEFKIYKLKHDSPDFDLIYPDFKFKLLGSIKKIFKN